MDQFAVANCVKEHALPLDIANTLQFEQIPFDLDDYSLLVMNGQRPRIASSSQLIMNEKLRVTLPE
jgi:galactokinase